MSKKRFNKNLLLLALVLILGSILMLDSLFREPYPIGDEHTYFYVVKSIDKDFFNPLKLMDDGTETAFIDHPTFTIYLGYFFSKLFGFSIISLRIMMVLIGISSIIICYFFAKRLFNEKIALLSAFLLSVSALFITNSSTYWIHTPLVLLLLVCSYFLFLYVKSGGKKNLFLSTFFLGLSLGTSYLAATFILPVLLVLIYYKKIDIKKKVQIEPALFISIIPLIIGMVLAFPQLLDPYHIFYSLKEQLGHALVLGAKSNPGSTFLGISYTELGIFHMFYYFGLLFFKLNFLFPLLLFSFYMLYKGERRDVFILLVILLPLMQLSLMKIHMDRYILFLMPFIYIAISKVILERKFAVWLFIGFILFTSWEIFYIHPYYELTGHYAGLSFSDIGAFRCQRDWEFNEYIRNLNNTLGATFCVFETDYYYNGNISSDIDYVITDVAYEKVKDDTLSEFLDNCGIEEIFYVKAPFYFLYKC